MPKLVTSNCERCGKQFSYYPSSYGREKKHCSKECFSLSTHIKTVCPNCGKKFWYHQSWPRKYCSRKCSSAVNSKKNLGIIELAPTKCELCGKEITNPQWNGRRFCNRKCFGEYLRKTQTGKPRPEVSGEHPDLQKRVTKNCKMCGKPFTIKLSHAGRRKFCSIDCASKWRYESGEFNGENNPHWKGGKLPYYGPNWRQQKRNARHRDNYTCQRCGKSENQLPRALDVHHIIPFRQFGLDRYKDANSLSNLVSLCSTCHRKTENGH